MFWERPSRKKAFGKGVLFTLIALPALLAFLLPAQAIPSPFAQFDIRVGYSYGWILFSTVIMVRFVDGKQMVSVGLACHPWVSREALGGFLLGVLMAIGAVLFLVIHGGVELGVTSLTALLGGMAGVALISAGEELLFRGYLFQRLLEIVGEIAGVIVIALIFTVAHLENPHISLIAIVNIFLAGILFGLLWLATRSLWSVIGLHIGWNLTIGPIFGLPVSGNLLVYDSLLRSSTSELPTFLSGGSFGPEGSLITTGILVGATLLVGKSRFFRIAPWVFASRYRVAVCSEDEASSNR